MITADIWTSSDQVGDRSISYSGCDKCNTAFTFDTGGGKGEVKCPKCDAVYKFWSNSKTDWGLEKI